MRQRCVSSVNIFFQKTENQDINFKCKNLKNEYDPVKNNNKLFKTF